MKLKTSMRDNNSVNGLVELCNDLKSHFGDKEITIVEIGSYMGESAEIFARELPNAKVICIDPWEGNYDNADWASSSDFNDVEKQFNLRMEMYPNIEKMKGYTDKDKIRIGDYRISITIDSEVKQIICQRIAHRREIYRVFP
jgi:mRNA-degrading endonuclease RelE of RelBE toxin-antitoxin system